jgi:hypothetical protein
LLLPIMIVDVFVAIPPAMSFAWFALVVTFMLLIHWRRVKYLELPGWVTVSWGCYPLIVLSVILL